MCSVLQDRVVPSGRGWGCAPRVHDRAPYRVRGRPGESRPLPPPPLTLFTRTSVGFRHGSSALLRAPAAWSRSSTSPCSGPAARTRRPRLRPTPHTASLSTPTPPCSASLGCLPDQTRPIIFVCSTLPRVWETTTARRTAHHTAGSCSAGGAAPRMQRQTPLFSPHPHSHATPALVLLLLLRHAAAADRAVVRDVHAAQRGGGRAHARLGRLHDQGGWSRTRCHAQGCVRVCTGVRAMWAHDGGGGAGRTRRPPVCATAKPTYTTTGTAAPVPPPASSL